MTANQSPGHAASDADLVRYLDGELGSDDRARVESAIAADAGLARRLESLRARSTRLNALLTAVDPSAESTVAADPVRRAGVRSIASGRNGSSRSRVRSTLSGAPAATWLKAAAIIIALVGAAMFVPPVRAWIVDQLQSLTSAEDTAAASSPDPVQSIADSFNATIPAPGPVFVIEFEHAPASGSLTIGTTTGDAAAYEIESQALGGSALVLPDGVRFQNEATSTSNYSVLVPPSITTVRLRVEGTLVRNLDITAGAAEVRVDLAVQGGAGSD